MTQIDAVCLSDEQQKNLNELLRVCELLVKGKRICMDPSWFPGIVDKLADALDKIKNS
jgi:hypothetical protein